MTPEAVSQPPPLTQNEEEDVPGDTGLRYAEPFTCRSPTPPATLSSDHGNKLVENTIEKKEAAKIIRETMMKTWADEWWTSSK